MSSDGDVMSWYDIKPFVKIGFVVNLGCKLCICMWEEGGTFD